MCTAVRLSTDLSSTIQIAGHEQVYATLTEAESLVLHAERYLAFEGVARGALGERADTYVALLHRALALIPWRACEAFT
jgi:hypothetical protein